jgi:hypothetical protein
VTKICWFCSKRIPNAFGTKYHKYKTTHDKIGDSRKSISFLCHECYVILEKQDSMGAFPGHVCQYCNEVHEHDKIKPDISFKAKEQTVR